MFDFIRRIFATKPSPAQESAPYKLEPNLDIVGQAPPESVISKPERSKKPAKKPAVRTKNTGRGAAKK